MKWNGEERRAMNPEYEYLKGQIVLLSEKIDNLTKNGHSSNESVATILKRHDETLYGNGKPGLTTTFYSLNDTIESHIIWDRWLYGSMLTILIFVLGILIKKNA